MPIWTPNFFLYLKVQNDALLIGYRRVQHFLQKLLPPAGCISYHSCMWENVCREVPWGPVRLSHIFGTNGTTDLDYTTPPPQQISKRDQGSSLFRFRQVRLLGDCAYKKNETQNSVGGGWPSAQTMTQIWMVLRFLSRKGNKLRHPCGTR